jgi:membrane protein implicated in regulation of membrane protease activity
MRPAALNAPGEFFFALLMAASPIIGSIWVTPDITKWTVFGVGVAMVVGVLLAALRPVSTPERTSE